MKLATAAFGRLCVETKSLLAWVCLLFQPPSGGCVLKRWGNNLEAEKIGSRLRAAVC